MKSCVSCLSSSFSNGPTFTRHYMIHGVAGHLFQRERSHRLGLIRFLNTPQASSFVPLHAQLLTSAPRCSLILFNSSSFHLFLLLLNLHRFLFLLSLFWNHHHPFLKIEMVPFFLFPHPIFFLKKISPWPIPILNIGVVLILFFKQPPPLSLFSPYLFSMGDGVGAVLPSVHAASPLPPTKRNVSHIMVLPPRVCTLYVDIFLYNNRCEKLTLS